MILTLDVTGPQAGKLGARKQKVFDSAGGTIGRLPDNDWVLSDPHVSGHHAVVRCLGGVFYVEDTSTNGVFINSPENRLVRGQPYALKSGDRIFVEPFEIEASIGSAPARAAGSPLDDPFRVEPAGAVSAASDPFAADHRVVHHAAVTPRPVRPLTPEFDHNLASGGDVEPLNLLGLGGDRPPAHEVPRAGDLAGSSLLNEHYRAPEPVASEQPVAAPSYGTLIPEDYDPLIGDDRSVRPPSAPAPRSSPQRAVVAPPPRAAPAVIRPLPPATLSNAPDAPGARTPGVVRKNALQRLPERPTPAEVPSDRGDVGLSAVLAGAGLEGVTVTPELARSFGEILRVVVSGVMDVLQARQQTKEEFRMGMTRFKPADNNPLKFSANVDDALHNLLIKRNAAYLGPVDAFEDAFADLRNHQMATLAGVRVAFEAMLAEFDPDRLQEQFDREDKKASLVSLPGRLRYWTRYRDRFHELLRDADASFRELFGDEFAKAYEEQLQRLKAQSRQRQR